MYEGTIIILNGVSSSGKSSIAKQLQTMMPEPFLHFSIDHHASTFPNHCWDSADLCGEELGRFWSAFHRSISVFADCGNRIIFDTVFENNYIFSECLNLFADFRVYYVGVYCNLETLLQREKNRSDRPAGQAEAQFPGVHSHGAYDVAVDTTEMTSEQCAITIRDFILSNPSPLAFNRK